MGIVLLFTFFWSTHGTGRFPARGNELRLLELQVEAYHHGQLSLLIQPHPDLLNSPNPYDPANNRGTRLLDAALYKGRYYTYFGPVPLVLILWPWYSLAGHHASGALVGWLLGAGIVVFQAAAIRGIVLRWFPRTSAWTLALIVAGVGATNLLPLLLVSHQTFDLPILAGLFFTAGAYAALVGVFSPGAGCWRWALASLCLGLAMGCRAVLIPPHLATLALALLFYTRREGLRPGVWAAAVLPVTVCLSALGLYNALRFGNPLDFGNRYTLVEMDWTKTAAFSLRYVPINLYYYWLAVPRLSPWFPYLLDAGASPMSPPAGYLATYVDRMAGYWTLYPLLGLFSCASAWLLFRREAPGTLKACLAALLAGAASLALILAVFVGSSGRYQSELAGLLVLPAATCGLWAASDRGVFRHVATAAWGLLATYTAVTSTLMACIGYSGLAAANPPAAERLGRVFDRIVYPAEKLVGLGPRKAVLRVTLPSGKAGKVEPLWVNGRPGDADFLYLFYASDQLIQFGFESMGRGGPKSPLVPVDYRVPHEIEVLAGAFLPPQGHPFYAERGSTGEERHLLLVKLDGVPVFAARVDFHDGKERFFWGESPDEPAFGRKFTGGLQLRWTRIRPADTEQWREVLK